MRRSNLWATPTANGLLLVDARAGENHASLPAVSGLNATLSELVPQIAQHGTFNFVLSQGDALWAHCSTKLHYLVRQHPVWPGAFAKTKALALNCRAG